MKLIGCLCFLLVMMTVKSDHFLYNNKYPSYKIVDFEYLINDLVAVTTYEEGLTIWNYTSNTRIITTGGLSMHPYVDFSREQQAVNTVLTLSGRLTNETSKILVYDIYAGNYFNIQLNGTNQGLKTICFLVTNQFSGIAYLDIGNNVLGFFDLVKKVFFSPPTTNMFVFTDTILGGSPLVANPTDTSLPLYVYFMLYSKKRIQVRKIQFDGLAYTSNLSTVVFTFDAPSNENFVSVASMTHYLFASTDGKKIYKFDWNQNNTLAWINNTFNVVQNIYLYQKVSAALLIQYANNSISYIESQRGSQISQFTMNLQQFSMVRIIQDSGFIGVVSASQPYQLRIVNLCTTYFDSSFGQGICSSSGSSCPNILYYDCLRNICYDIATTPNNFTFDCVGAAPPSKQVFTPNSYNVIAMTKILDAAQIASLSFDVLSNNTPIFDLKIWDYNTGVVAISYKNLEQNLTYYANLKMMSIGNNILIIYLDASDTNFTGFLVVNYAVSASLGLKKMASTKQVTSLTYISSSSTPYVAYINVGASTVEVMSLATGSVAYQRTFTSLSSLTFYTNTQVSYLVASSGTGISIWSYSDPVASNFVFQSTMSIPNLYQLTTIFPTIGLNPFFCGVDNNGRIGCIDYAYNRYRVSTTSLASPSSVTSVQTLNTKLMAILDAEKIYIVNVDYMTIIQETRKLDRAYNWMTLAIPDAYKLFYLQEYDVDENRRINEISFTTYSELQFYGVYGLQGSCYFNVTELNQNCTIVQGEDKKADAASLQSEYTLNKLGMILLILLSVSSFANIITIYFVVRGKGFMGEKSSMLPSKLDLPSIPRNSIMPYDSQQRDMTHSLSDIQGPNSRESGVDSSNYSQNNINVRSRKQSFINPNFHNKRINEEENDDDQEETMQHRLSKSDMRPKNSVSNNLSNRPKNLQSAYVPSSSPVKQQNQKHQQQQLQQQQQQQQEQTQQPGKVGRATQLPKLQQPKKQNFLQQEEDDLSQEQMKVSHKALRLPDRGNEEEEEDGTDSKQTFVHAQSQLEVRQSFSPVYVREKGNAVLNYPTHDEFRDTIEFQNNNKAFFPVNPTHIAHLPTIDGSIGNQTVNFKTQAEQLKAIQENQIINLSQYQVPEDLESLLTEPMMEKIIRIKNIVQLFPKECISQNSADMIGQGGFGNVYAITLNGIRYAEKVIMRDLKSLGLADLHNFLKTVFKEINMMQNLTVLNTERLLKIRGLAFDLNKSSIFRIAIYMDLMDQDLQQFLVSFRHDEAIIQKLKILRDICEAIIALDNNNYIHGDIKPPNILLDKNLNAYLADFSTVKAQQHAVTMPSENVLVFTARFSAPEFIIGYKKGKTTDVWSLGCIAFQMFTTLAPWHDIPQKDLVNFLKQNKTDMVTHFYNTNIGDTFQISDQDIETLILSCTHYDPKERLNAKELHEMIDKMIKRRQKQMLIK